MVNPGAFKGARKAFLTTKREAYAEAVRDKRSSEQISDIVRCYFKRFPPSLPHDQEPSEEHLASVDDDGADPDPLEGLSDEEAASVGKIISLRREVS
jgi:hypothetical protein